MDLLISYIDGDMDRSIWINAKSTTATEIKAEINLKEKVLPLEEQIPKEFHDFLDVSQRKRQHVFWNEDPGTTKLN